MHVLTTPQIVWLVKKYLIENENRYMMYIILGNIYNIYCLSFVAHLGAGLWGVLAAAILKKDTGLVYKWDKISSMVRQVVDH